MTAKARRKKPASRGIPGPPGPAGPAGHQGTRGEAGSRGRSGLTGVRGRTGLTGERGRPGPSAVTVTVGNSQGTFVALQEQIETIYSELEIQMRRMAQIQAQLDLVRATLREIAPSGTLRGAAGVPHKG